MDDRLQKALEHSNYKVALASQRENMKLRFANTCIIGKNGGLFTVNPTLISFVSLLVQREQTTAILIDDKGNPIRIDALDDFLDDIISTWNEATNEFFSEHEKLRKARTVKAVVGL